MSERKISCQISKKRRPLVASGPREPLAESKIRQLELKGTVELAGRGRVGTTQLTTASLRVSGFQDKGANWKDQQLYYFSEPTGICYQEGRVVWPDGTLSADHYNLARVKQHCRDVARAIYPRKPAARTTLAHRDVAGAAEKDAHSFELGRDTPRNPNTTSHPKGPPKARP